MATAVDDPAAEAYAALAPYYETLARSYAHDRWMRDLESIARELGLRGRRVLDVGCGTGKSLKPLLELGYDGVGCDISPEMLRVATQLLPAAELHHADMRELPDLGRFPWVTCMNDALNYLLSSSDLVKSLVGMARSLETGGLMTFDVNTLRGHREQFDETWAVDEPEAFMCWRGLGRHGGAGEPGTSELTVFARDRAGWRRTVSRHRQRWWGARDVVEAASAAGLSIIARYGQRRGAVLEESCDELEHTKAVYFLRRP